MGACILTRPVDEWCCRYTTPERTECMDEFLEWYANRYQRKHGRRPAASTMRSKRSRLTGCVNQGGLEGCVGLATVTGDRERVSVLLDQLSARMTPGSLRHVVDALRELGAWAVAKGIITRCELTADDTPPNNPRKAITVYTDDEVDRMIAAARGRSLRWWAFLATLAESGRRVGEVLGLEYMWIHPLADPPHIALPYTKNRRQAYVPLTRLLREEVLTAEVLGALKSSDSSFKRDPGVYPFPWSYNCAAKMLARHCKVTGVQNRGFHNFRHTKATSLLAKGVPIQAVSALLGHSNVATTDRIYSHVSALDFARYVD